MYTVEYIREGFGIFINNINRRGKMSMSLTPDLSVLLNTLKYVIIHRLDPNYHRNSPEGTCPLDYPDVLWSFVRSFSLRFV